MDKEALTFRVSRIRATVVVAVAILAGVYGALSSRRTSMSGGYINEFPGNGLVKNSGSGMEKTFGPVIHGSLIDDEGKPVQGLQVELIPADKTGDAQLDDTKHAWSDKSGEYEFQNIPAGDYFVGVHVNGAPDGEYPFAKVYYPGVAADGDAERVHVEGNHNVSLKWMRLRRLETLTLDLKIVWEDGESVERGNLLFYNTSYPHQGVIGDVAPQFDAGHAQFELPVGFEYYARAKVDCDAGTTIKTIESRPIQELRLNENFRGAGLTFVIPVAKCTLWTPSHN
jgi:hypothetical protein